MLSDKGAMLSEDPPTLMLLLLSAEFKAAPPEGGAMQSRHFVVQDLHSHVRSICGFSTKTAKRGVNSGFGFCDVNTWP